MKLQYIIDLETKYRSIFRQDIITDKDIKAANKILLKLKNTKQ